MCTYNSAPCPWERTTPELPGAFLTRLWIFLASKCRLAVEFCLESAVQMTEAYYPRRLGSRRVFFVRESLCPSLSADLVLAAKECGTPLTSA